MNGSALPSFTVGAWTVEPDLCRISREDEQFVLQARWMDVLVYLAENAGRVISTEDIIENVWGNVEVSQDSVYVTLSHLRKELARDRSTDTYIQTISGRGYRLVAPVVFPEVVAARGRRTVWIAVSTMMLTGAALLIMQPWNADESLPAIPNSIAVLPFDDLQPSDDEFALGFVDGLVVELDRIDGLNIMGRTSSYSMASRDVTATEMGDELGVATILEGNLRRNGDNLEVMAQLIRTDNGLHIWADTYRMDVGASDRIRTDIARQVAEGLGLVLPPAYVATLDPFNVPIILRTKVNTYTNDNQEWPRVIAMADGGYAISWRSMDQDGSNWGVYAQRFGADGARIGNEFRFHTTPRESQYLVEMATRPNGGFAAVWQSWEADGVHWGVVGRLFDANANPASAEFVINDYGDKEQSGVDIATLSDGRFAAIYQSKGQVGLGYEIFARMFSASGVPLGPSFQVNTYEPNTQGGSRLSNLNEHHVIAVWESIGVDGSAFGVSARVLASDGQPLGPEIQVNTYTDNQQQYTDVVGLTGGGAVIVWQSQGQDFDGIGGWGIFGQRFDSTGKKLGTEFPVNTFTQEDQRLPRLAAMPDGGFFVTWMSDGQIASGMDVFGQRFAKNGSPVGAELFVNVVTNSYQRNPSAAALQDGSVIVAFHADDWDGSKFGIFSRRLVFSGLSGDSMLGKESGDTFVLEEPAQTFRIDNFDTEIDRIDVSALGIQFSDLDIDQTENGVSVGTPFGTIFVQNVMSLSEYHFLM